MLHENHRIVVTNGGDHHALGLIGRGRQHHLQAGRMGENRIEHLAVFRPLAPAAPDDHAHGQGNLVHAIGDKVGLGGVVQKLLHREKRKIHPLVHHDRPLPHQGRAYGDAGQAVFRHRHLDDACRPKTFHKAKRGAENALGISHALAHQIDGGVRLHALGGGLQNGGGGGQATGV